MFISYKEKYEEASKYIKTLQEGGENISKFLIIYNEKRNSKKSLFKFY